MYSTPYTDNSICNTPQSFLLRLVCIAWGSSKSCIKIRKSLYKGITKIKYLMGFIQCVFTHLLPNATFFRMEEKHKNLTLHTVTGQWWAKYSFFQEWGWTSLERDRQIYFSSSILKRGTPSGTHSKITSQKETTLLGNLLISPLLNKFFFWHPTSICFPILKYGKNTWFCFIFRTALTGTLLRWFLIGFFV